MYGYYDDRRRECISFKRVNSHERRAPIILFIFFYSFSFNLRVMHSSLLIDITRVYNKRMQVLSIIFLNLILSLLNVRVR